MSLKKDLGFSRKAPDPIQVGENQLYIASHDPRVLEQQLAEALAQQSNSDSETSRLHADQLQSAINDLKNGKDLHVDPFSEVYNELLKKDLTDFLTGDKQ